MNLPEPGPMAAAPIHVKTFGHVAADPALKSVEAPWVALVHYGEIYHPGDDPEAYARAS